MKCLSVTAPYGTLIALAEKYPELGKHIETRSWATSYRGPLAIHQAKGLGPVGGKAGLFRLCSVDPFASVLRAWHAYAPSYPEVWLPFGTIVAVCELVSCVEIDGRPTGFAVHGRPDSTLMWWLTADEQAFGDYTPGRFAWLLANVRALPEPIPAKCALGLWEYEGQL